MKPCTWAGAVVMAAVFIGAPRASAQVSLARQLGDPSAARAPEPEADEEPHEEPDADGPEEGPWAGPQVQLGYSFLSLSDGYGGGDTHAGWFEVFLRWPPSQLRTGLLAEVGGRDISVAGVDLFARAALEIGFQLTEVIDPVVPYVSVIGTAGAVVGERFETTVAYGFGGGGFEVGAMLRLFRNLHASVAFSYVRLEMDGAGFDVFMFRGGLGL